MTTTPGEYLSDELTARGWTIPHLAQLMNVPVVEVEEFIRGDRRLLAAGAEHLAQALGTSPQLWLNLQKTSDKENPK